MKQNLKRTLKHSKNNNSYVQIFLKLSNRNKTVIEYYTKPHLFPNKTKVRKETNYNLTENQIIQVNI